MTVADKILHWSTHCVIGRVVGSNIPRERFLPGSEIQKLLDAIDAISWGSPPTRSDLNNTAKAYRLACYQCSRLGGEVPSHVQPAVLGRAVEFGLLAIELENAYPTFFSTLEDARDFLLRVVCGDPLSVNEQKLTMSLHPKSAWATWNIDDPSGDPFQFANEQSEKVRACIGLDPRHRDSDGLILLVFTPPAGISLYRPTIADAELYPFFEPPPPPEERHGWTRPWLPSHLFDERDLIPRPEVIHKPIEFRAVTTKTRLV